MILLYIYYTTLLLFFSFKLYFIDYTVTVVPIFPPLSTPPITLSPFRQSPHHCSCPWVMYINSLATPFPMLYFTSLWLFCLYFLIPSSLHPFPYTSLPSGSHQNTLCIHDSVFVLICLVCFLDSIVDRFVIITHNICNIFCHFCS